jgi:hypothetical protein
MARPSELLEAAEHYTAKPKAGSDLQRQKNPGGGSARGLEESSYGHLRRWRRRRQLRAAARPQ